MLSVNGTAPELVPFAADQRYVTIGTWGLNSVPICLDLNSAEVVCIRVRSNESYLVNTSLPHFVDSLDAIAQAAPLSPANPAYASHDDAAEAVRTTLMRIDGEAFELGDFWDTIIDDIANGDYDE